MATNPSTTSSPRKIVRGSSVTFEELFIEADGTPIPPLDPLAHPSVSIVSPDQTILATGVASALGDGRYRFQWFAPADADLSSPDRPWRIDWLIVVNNNRQIQRSASFEVSDTIEGDPTERAYTYLTLFGESERLISRFFTEQDEISVTIRDQLNNVLESYDKSQLTVVHEQGTVAYYVDTTPAEGVGIFNVVWRSRQTPVSPHQTTVQQLRVPELHFWTFQPSLRMFLDKIQKKVGMVQAYSDSDLYEYMQRGMGTVNAYNPATSWNMSAFPVSMGFEEFILLAAAWWGLQAQYLSEGELAFDYSGQSTTLTVDRTGTYESAISRIKEHMDTHLPKLKSTWMRRQSTGIYAGRPYNWGLSNSVVRVSTTNGAQQNRGYSQLFVNLGLI
jgi:hypothetical protein